MVGDPTQPQTQVGPLVSAGQRNAVEEYLADAREGGARFICGGGRPHGKGYYLQPAVLPESRRPRWREEIFGPVAAVTPFDNEEEMIREVNALPYGLSGSVWTNDLRRALRGSAAGWKAAF